MDRLSKALLDTHLRSAVLATLDFAAPWNVDFEGGSPGAPTHYIVEGDAWLDRPEEVSIRLSAGDLIMFPQWDAHALRSFEAGAMTRSIDDVITLNGSARWRNGLWLDQPLSLSIPGPGTRTRLLSLVFELETRTRNTLLHALPRFVHLRTQESGMGPSIRRVLEFLTEESAAQRDGYAVVSSRLAELLFMQIVRTQLLTRPDQVAGWLRGLVDPAIGCAIAAIHERPGDKWTIEALARVSGLSRSSFCARFRELMDTTPHGYVQTVRMDVAASRLQAGERIKTLSEDLGYATPYGFSQAFRREYGRTPGSTRGTPGAAKVGE